MANFGQGWYVIYTRPHFERKVADELGRVEISNYLPTVKRVRTWHDRRKYIDVPLFQSYVFVNLQNQEDYYESLKINGALNYIRFGKEIARVNDKTIDDIKTLINYRQDIEVTDELIKPGRQLFIGHGPLAGISCEVIELSANKKKILVRLQLLQRNLMITLPADYFITDQVW